MSIMKLFNFSGEVFSEQVDLKGLGQPTLLLATVTFESGLYCGFTPHLQFVIGFITVRYMKFSNCTKPSLQLSISK
ncbi:hypothetical protein ACROYT_G005048 [Oculina patagonica]